MSSSNCRMRLEALDAYLHGMLNETQQREITAHLLVCPECNKTLSALEAETYTISKGLRNVPTPPMSVSARDLVSKYSDAKPATAPSPYASMESSQTMQPAAASTVKPGPKRSARALKKAASGAVFAWNFAREKSLFKVAGITFASGMAVWFALATARRIEAIGQAQAQQAEKFDQIQRSQADLRTALNTTSQENQQAIVDISKQLKLNVAKEATVALLQLMQEQEKLNGVIAEVKSKIDKVGSQISDTNRLNDELAKLKQRLAEMQELGDRLKKIAEKPEAPAPAIADAAPVIPEPEEPGTLRLLSNPDHNVAWENNKDGTMSGLLMDKNQPIGWTISLSNLAGSTPDDLTEAHTAGAGVSEQPRFAGAAASNGHIFVGNGSADKNLVAFDASGKLLWSVRTPESGGGAPIIAEDGRTVFFAENTSVRAINVSNGVQNWNRGLGGAVLTQPAVDAHHMYVVHASSRNSPPGVGDPKYPFSITCLHTDGGNVVWTKGLNADAISAPVIEGGKVFVSTRDGTVSVFDGHGNSLPSYQANATSAPVVYNGAMYFSAWAANAHFGFEESLCSLGIDNQNRGVEHLAGPFPAPYYLTSPVPAAELSSESLARARLLAAAPREEQSAPALRSAATYYGARPTIVDQTAYVVLGDHFVSWDLKQAKLLWSVKIVGRSDSPSLAREGQPPLTPPAYANGRLYVGSVWGDVLCIDALTGTIKWRFRLPGAQSVTSQIVLDQGRAYTTTSKGLLVCIDAGDPNATGWTTWGGSPSHNGPSATKWIRKEN